MYEELAHNVSAVDRGSISWDDPLISHAVWENPSYVEENHRREINGVLKNEEKSPPPGVEKSFWFEAGSAMILVHWINEPVYFQPWVEPDATLEMSSDGID
ncbi:7190_t:CDS:2 [Entrophospora sp. SA101]|nr:5561_t:CDS:2 [Entrophospora sp. SA101]CAJ0902015.1 7190_t:CDS:2 [Entrophospora sp. SA101]